MKKQTTFQTLCTSTKETHPWNSAVTLLKNSGRRIVLAGLLVWMSSMAYAQLPTGFVVNKLTGNTINEAVAMGHAEDGRIFIAERSGNLKVYKNGIVSTVHTVATTTAVEQGLLGLALHHDFSTNGQCYLYYTNTASTLHYLDMIVIDATNAVTSVTRIMQFDPIMNGFHNGGAMLFKHDHLYICIGESNEPAQAALLDTYRGKVLRLLDDGQPAPGNPYYDEVGASRQKRSLWAIGMRNPWYMSMDPVSEKLYVINVGGNYEEINDVTAPDPTKNYHYGWAGSAQSGPDQPNTTIYPTYTYGHAGWGCAITSGVAFNPTGVTDYPLAYKNRFYFTDWCSGWLRSFDLSNPAATYQEFSAADFGNVLGLSLGIDGNIYYFKYGTNGSLNRLEYTLPAVPVIVNHPQSQSVVTSDPVTFSVTASGSNPLSYQWYKNSVLIGGAIASTYTIASTDVNSAGPYSCVVTNTFGTATSNNAVLTLLPFNARPVATILTPLSTLTWNVLNVINFSGSATDAEEGTLPASAYQWEVQLFHKDCPTCEHWHPGPAVASAVTSGSFIADNGGETSSNIWVRLILTVTDAQGRTGRDSVDIHPNKVILSASTNKTGLQVSMGGSAVAPFSKTEVVNSALTLSAPTTQLVGDSLFTFVSWNIGGAATQTIRVPSVAATYKATYTSTYVGQTPYGGTPHPVPGTVEAEDFDLGGEDKGYHDNSIGNAGNAYRTTENVDIQNCDEGGYNLAYVGNGEWLEYTLDVTQTGLYTVSLRVATPNANRLAHLDIDDVNISGSLAIPNTGAYQNWQTVSFSNVMLTAGISVLRLTMDADNFNVSYIQFELNTVIADNNTDASAAHGLFEVFPNPSENTIALKSAAAINHTVTITMMNVQGQMEWEKSISGIAESFAEQIDVSSLAAGVYFMRIQSNDMVQTIKIIKK